MKLLIVLRVVVLVVLFVWPVLLFAGMFEVGSPTRWLGTALPFGAAILLIAEDLLRGREVD